jgi:hypothetical protein
MGEIKAPEIPRPEKEDEDLMTQERVDEIIDVLFPWGCSTPKENWYTGVSPYIGETQNIITVIARDPNWGVLSICLDKFSEDYEGSICDCLGFYKGIMKVIAPELHSEKERFDENYNVLDFHWGNDKQQENKFFGKYDASGIN